MAGKYATSKNIMLSATAHDTLTKRDDVRIVMKHHLKDLEIKFGLYPGRHVVSDNNQELFYGALIIDMSPKKYIKEYIAIEEVYNKARE